MKEEESFELSEDDVEKLALTTAEAETIISEEEMINQQIDLAVTYAIPKETICVIGRRFVWCVSKTILKIIQKMCADPKYKKYICWACRNRRPDVIIRLVCPIVYRTFSCIPCGDVKWYVNWICNRLVVELFPTICRICRC
ncbi:MAG: hypothetical protein O2V44_01970 [Candidatus Bathyarchaeota archaeon]|nr:hypothetical protein [Candidatus Bathyarchaeota archaeon]